MNKEKRVGIEHEIMSLLSKNNASGCTFHFTTVQLESEHQEGMQVLLMSHNPRHNQSFLVHEETAKSEDACYTKMVKFIRELPRSKDLKHYMIKWNSVDDGDNLQESHFFGHSEYDALNKLYSTMDNTKVRFYSMEIRPSA